MEMIRVRNNLRRPVMFRIPGMSVRLGPGQSVRLPGHCKETPELKRLCLRKSLSILEEEETALLDTGPGAEAGKEEEKRKKPGKKKSGKKNEKSQPLEEE